MSEYPRLPLPPPPPPYNSGGRTSVPGFTTRETHPTRQFIDQPSDTSNATEDPSTYRSRSIEADIRPPPCADGGTGTGGTVRIVDPLASLTDGVCRSSCSPLDWSIRSVKKFASSGGIVTSEIADAFIVNVSSSAGPVIDGLSVTVSIDTELPYTPSANNAYYAGAVGGFYISPASFLGSTSSGDAQFEVLAGFSGQPYYKAGRIIHVVATASTNGGTYWHSRRWVFAARSAAPDATGVSLATAESATYQPQIPPTPYLGSPVYFPGIQPLPPFRAEIDCCESVGIGLGRVDAIEYLGPGLATFYGTRPGFVSFSFTLATINGDASTPTAIVQFNGPTFMSGCQELPCPVTPAHAPYYPTPFAYLYFIGMAIPPTGTTLMYPLSVNGAFALTFCGCSCGDSRPDDGT